MKHIVYNYSTYINQRGGMLASQLFTMLPADSRPCYATFLKRLRETPGVYVSKAFDGSGSLYVSNIRKPATRTMRLNIMISEWEIMTNKMAAWFLPEFALYGVYLSLQDAFPSSRWLVESRQWLIKYSLKKQAILTQKRASPIISGKPPITLLNLFQRGIYLFLTKRGNEWFLRFYYFDIFDDINGRKYKQDVAMIFEFLAYHEILVAFDIVLYLWTDSKADLYETIFEITKSDLEKINNRNIRYNYKPRHLVFLAKQSFVSLGIGSASNRVIK